MSEPLSVGPSVVLNGRWLAVARQAIHIANISRRRNGLPESRDYLSLLDAVTTALSRSGHTAALPIAVEAWSTQPDDISVEEAARMLAKSHRSVQRMAPRLGGRLIGGRWILDRRAVEEHIEGTHG